MKISNVRVFGTVYVPRIVSFYKFKFRPKTELCPELS